MNLVILDRDGVINQDSDQYIKSADEWLPIPGSLEAIARLCRADYRVVVVTNQSGIARGLFDARTLNQIHRKMVTLLHDKGGKLEAIFFCPHGPDDDCGCRKPATGMFEELSSRLGLRLDGVPVVGDSIRDLKPARTLNALPVLVKTGKGQKSLVTLRASTDVEASQDIPVYKDLAAFTDDLLEGGLDPQIQELRARAAT
jgi:D-glycero-D-manno-heptose 1,7-bisphosphate phosphatase